MKFCEVMGDRLSSSTKIGKLLFEWPGDVSAAGASLPLRLHGCLHRLVISGECKALSKVFPPNHNDVTDDQMWDAFAHALTAHETAIENQLQLAPQTNEVRRSAALLPGFLTIADQTGNLPFVLSELGASAGLNLNWDRFAYSLNGQVWGDQTSEVQLNPEWRGNAPIVSDIEIVEREGCDLNPIDLSNPEATQALLSYLWADQMDRLERTRAAIKIAHAHPYRVEKQDAVNWLVHRLSRPRKGQVHIIYHTIAWQYFDEADKLAGQEIIENAGRSATPTAPIAWLSLETDYKKPGAALTLRIWQGKKNDGETQFLGRADYHGRWVDWAI